MVAAPVEMASCARQQGLSTFPLDRSIPLNGGYPNQGGPVMRGRRPKNLIPIWPNYEPDTTVNIKMTMFP